MNRKMVIAGAILMCAVMVVVAGAPLVMADTHHIVKGAQGPRASAVTWSYTPTENGFWSGHIVNSGLRWLVIQIHDEAGSLMLRQHIRFAAYPTDTVDSERAPLAAGRTYTITAIPNGPQTTFCDVTDVFTIAHAPVAVIGTPVVNQATVSVDGSGSYDVDPGDSVVAWAWDFGDGGTATGVTATHTYVASGNYTITLTVMDTTGLTGSAQVVVYAKLPPPPNKAPVAVFTSTVTDLTVAFDGTGSFDPDVGDSVVAWAWDFGDGSTGTGSTVTHTYATYGLKTVSLTVTDTHGATGSVSHNVTLVEQVNKPIASFTTLISGATVTVNGSASTSSPGTTIIAYKWDFGDFVIAGGAIHSHYYISTGTYAITLVVVDSNNVASDPLVKTVSVTNGNPPPFPYIVYGMTQTTGAVAIPGAQVTVTDVRTGETYIGGAPSDEGGQYSLDISLLMVQTGDGLVVNAVGPGGLLTGSATGTVDTTVPYIGINVTLT